MRLAVATRLAEDAPGSRAPVAGADRRGRARSAPPLRARPLYGPVGVRGRRGARRGRWSRARARPRWAVDLLALRRRSRLAVARDRQAHARARVGLRRSVPGPVFVAATTRTPPGSSCSRRSARATVRRSRWGGSPRARTRLRDVFDVHTRTSLTSKPSRHMLREGFGVALVEPFARERRRVRARLRPAPSPGVPRE